MPRHSEATKSAIKNADRYCRLGRASTFLCAVWVLSTRRFVRGMTITIRPLKLNPERQSFKCWVCGAGGDVFDFVMNIERVEFPEALRMLADRAGVALEARRQRRRPCHAGRRRASCTRSMHGPKSSLPRRCRFRRAAQDYLDHRGIIAAEYRAVSAGLCTSRAGLASGAGPAQAIQHGFCWCEAGLASRSAESPGSVRERFRGRLIFPIHDDRGRAIGFGGRILPDVEQKLADAGEARR